MPPTVSLCVRHSALSCGTFIALSCATVRPLTLGVLWLPKRPECQTEDELETGMGAPRRRRCGEIIVLIVSKSLLLRRRDSRPAPNRKVE